MVTQKIPHKSLRGSAIFLLFAVFAAILLLMQTNSVLAATVEATAITSKDLTSRIEALQIKQIGDGLVSLELRGVKISHPAASSAPGASIVLNWTGVRFPRDTDRQDWWDEYGWSVLKIRKDLSDAWRQSYDYPLVERIEVRPNGKNGITMTIIGEKELQIKRIIGMAGSDRIRIELKTDVSEITPYKPARASTYRAPSDPLGMDSLVTLELRDVSVKDAFRMLAEFRHLNLVIDPSVPDDPVTFSFKKAKFSEVFSYLLRMSDLTYAMMGKTLIVGTAESMGKTLGKNQEREYKIAYGDIAKLPATIMSLVNLSKPPVVDERRRVLYITATPSQHRDIENIINRLDHPGKQVMLEARLLEINDDSSQQLQTVINAAYNGWLVSYGSANGLGVEYTKNNGQGGITNNSTLSGTSTTQGRFPIPGKLINNYYNPVNTVDHSLKLFDSGFTALETNNKGKVLAKPSLVTIDGQKSTIKLTHNYLYQSGVDTNGNPQFSKQETGPTLEITPLIGRDGFITLKLKITTGEIVQFRQSGNSEAPETTNREVDTTIRVRDGELFVIGGLNQEIKTRDHRRVPVLGYIPLLGELFKYKSDSHTKSEMVFVVVPHILDIPTGAAEVYKMPEQALGK
jgi:type IV pilus assembly protein PilQ